MSFPWRSFVDLAYELLKTPSNSTLEEASFRSAVSRSYYGVFGIAKNYLAANKVKIPIVDTHKFVSSQYQKSPNKNRREIGEKMKRLWRERKAADYDESAKIDLKRAEISHQLAILILEKFKSLGV